MIGFDLLGLWSDQGLARRGGAGARRGFTLVELLVVIGIIAVLIGILLPTLGRARESAKLIQCQSNLKQVATAMRMYANDYRDRFPDQYTVGGAPFRRAPGQVVPGDPSSFQERYGIAAVLHGIDPSEDPANIFTTSVAAQNSTIKTKFKYLPGDSKVWICPGARDDMQDFGNTYAYNSAIMTTSSPDSTGNWTSKQRGRTVRYPGESSPPGLTFLVSDNFTNKPWATGQRRTTGTLPTYGTAERQWPHPYQTRIRRALNVLYIDGNVGIAIYNPRTGALDSNIKG